MLRSRWSAATARDALAPPLQAAALDAIPDDEVTNSFRISFKGQSGTDAGGLTDDWLSLFMQEALDPYASVQQQPQ